MVNADLFESVNNLFGSLSRFDGRHNSAQLVNRLVVDTDVDFDEVDGLVVGHRVVK